MDTSQIPNTGQSKETGEHVESVRQFVEISDDSEESSKSFIKITLTQTGEILLYDSPSETVLADSDEVQSVLEANERYDYLTKGKGKNRRTTTAESQTSDVLFKSRAVNTERIHKEDVGTFVSNYDMFDTYKDLATQTTSLETRDENQKQIVITTYIKEGEKDPCDFLKTSENFRLSSMVLERLCAGNVFREKQKRFRNMYKPDPLAMDVKYYYRLETLWTYKIPMLENKAVVSASWCEDNGDILAIGYGTYYFQTKTKIPSGYVCVWSIKNPVNPERMYKFDASVTAVSFSKQTPQLLAIGLSDGRIEVRDIRHETHEIVAQSSRQNQTGFEPIWQIKWIDGDGIFKQFGQILTASQDGRIVKYSFTSGPFLQGYLLMRLSSVEGVVEGLPIAKSKELIDANRHPQALSLTMHPQKKEIYFVGTNEGCRHRCSINYSKQHSAILQVHNGSVYNIEYSPWSPKVFLTCGSDWYIRIWIEGIFKPIVELSSGIGCVNSAHWCPINSTIIASCTSDSVDIWDIRRRVLKPVASHKFTEGNSPITIIKFSKCGRSLMVGTANGTTYICALEDMPFAPHFQFAALECALHQVLNADQSLLDQVKSTKNLSY